MSTQEPNRKRRTNRPTDPFGGPGGQGNKFSIVIGLVVLAFFVYLQYSNSDLGGLLNGPAAQSTVAPTPVMQATQDVAGVDNAESTQAPAAQATATLAPAQTSTPVSAGQARGVQTPRATILPTPTANAPPVARASNLPTIAHDDLPPEAQETIVLIDQGGPFPFSRDGITFQNRERILPRQNEGYYREYTVITPGTSTRGARRIVTGDGGEMYYTDDHYESFREIVR